MRIAAAALVSALLLQDGPAPDLTLADTTGTKRPVAPADAKAVALVFVATECPMVNKYVHRLNAIAKEYREKGVAVLGVNSNALEPPEAVAAHAKQFDFPVLLDRDQTLADALKVTLTPTAVVLDADRRVRYRGLIDDHKTEELVKRRHLREALDAVLGGKEIASTEPVGCTIQRAIRESAAEVTWSGRVAKIVHERCAACHRPGQVAPFSLLTYEQARRWSRDIKRSTQARRMPPWKPENRGVFKGERWMTDEEIAILATWADAGAPAGDLSKAPAAPRFAEGWALGEPDLVLDAGGDYEVAAVGDDEYRSFVLDPKLEEDRTVTSVEFRPGNAAVVHHVFTYVDPKGVSLKLDERDPGLGYSTRGTGPGFAPLGDMGGWGPGMQPSPLPEGTGYLLPKGSKIVMEVHYHKNGRREKDRTRMGIRFAKGPVRQRVRSNVVINFDFEIPAGAKRHLVTAGWVVKEDLHAFSIVPHMHLLGKEILCTALLPDKKEITLVHVKEWDFNWQETYVFKEPVALPAGTRVRLKGWFDNSAENPNQPRTPPRDVRFGEATTDEMCVAYLQYTLDREGK